MLRHMLKSPKVPNRTVIIGASGFVGSSIFMHLKAVGASVVGLTREHVDLLDIGAAKKLASLLQPGDTVVATSAIAPCRDCAMLADNMHMVENILTALNLVDVSHVINISSDAIYADSDLPLTEASVTAPYSHHGAMHLAREIGFLNEINAPLVNLRPTLIFGASDPHNGYGPNRFRRLATKGDDLLLFGNGEEQRDHVFIDDVAELVFRVICRKSIGTLNIATGHVKSFRWLAEKTQEITGSKSSIISTERVGLMPHRGYRPFDITACKEAFPDFNYTLIEEGLIKSLKEI
ncbi:NAD-dependent epimerase/dehydratase family protein [Alphaproteobacteria bacterium]|nr:NAD-dependent epimerase/dehydratase family protein [Alphaproteobacteria bacterium]